jgi:DNA invertase Pin-like site-specific DNA recombinase
MSAQVLDAGSPRRVAVYGRTSRDTDSEEVVAHQHRLAEDAVRRLDPACVVVARVADRRPAGDAPEALSGLGTLVHEIETGTLAVDTLVVATLDRLGRTPEALALVKRLQREHGINILPLDGGGGGLETRREGGKNSPTS